MVNVLKPDFSTTKREGAREDRVLDVTVLLLDGGYASTAIGPTEVFHSAGVLWNRLQGEQGEPRFRVRVASSGGRSVSAPCALRLMPSHSLEDIEHTDIVILPGLGPDATDQIAHHPAVIPFLQKWHARGAHIAGICTGVAFLAEAGLLDGRRATTHWAVAEQMRARYPKVKWRPEEFVTEDNGVLCGGGVYASIDVALYLVEKFCGHEIALQCSRALLVSMPRACQSGYAVLPLSRPHTDDRIRDAQEFMQQNFRREVPIAELADRAGMGQRNFIRRFKAATGEVPGGYLQTLRVAAAKEMLERGAASVQAVCTEIGYGDIAFFRRLFKRHTGMTPGEYRTRFAKMALEQADGIAGERQAA
jgi:transcriptional regulator GlxA family with amidase domain